MIFRTQLMLLVVASERGCLLLSRVYFRQIYMPAISFASLYTLHSLAMMSVARANRVIVIFSSPFFLLLPPLTMCHGKKKIWKASSRAKIENGKIILSWLFEFSVFVKKALEVEYTRGFHKNTTNNWFNKNLFFSWGRRNRIKSLDRVGVLIFIEIF